MKGLDRSKNRTFKLDPWTRHNLPRLASYYKTSQSAVLAMLVREQFARVNVGYQNPHASPFVRALDDHISEPLRAFPGRPDAR